jgi:replicative DNA helicase
VQLLVGRQGSGKSTFAAWVIAQLSTGRRWPAEAEDRLAVPCGMLSLEEPAERLVARLIAAGADLDSVHILGQVEDHDDEGRPYQRPWRLPGDCGALEATIFRLGLAAVSASDLRSVAGGRQCELIANCRSRQPAELRELSFRELVTQCE